jgi:hypothetical protein
MSNFAEGSSETSPNLDNVGPTITTSLPNVFIPSSLNLEQLLSPVPSTVQAPMVSLTDRSHNLNYGRRVQTIDPKIVSDRLREYNIVNADIASLTPKYLNTPAQSLPTPPIGSVLKTPPDLTSTYVNDLGAESLTQEETPDISKPIYDFIQDLPSAPPVTVQEEQKQSTTGQRVNDAKIRADYRVKFGILREAYPNMNIPEPQESATIEEIEAAYKQYIKRIHVESSVEQNKIYLLILWLLIDVVGTRFFKLPFHGRYVKSQFKYMQKYQMLLIELGERNYSEGGGEGWSVEFRLLAMAIFHGVIFALVQLLASKLGGAGAANEQMADQLRDVIDNFLTQNKGTDVLRRAEQASSDQPVPPPVPENPAPPMGDLGAMIGNFAPMLMNLFGGGDAKTATEEKPQIKRPTTFAARHRRTQPNPNTNL